MQDARRWVVATCVDIDRADLVECAELGVSELVTNALLHGAPPIQVRVRGTWEHPRVEVRDGSTTPPLLPSVTEPTDEDDLLLTFGRGLSIVARSADAWGAEIEEDGKIVWFNPAPVFSEDDGVEGVITGIAREDRSLSDSPDMIEFEIRDVPLKAYVAFHRHYRELRREVRLLALAHEADYPLAKSLSDLFGSLEQPLHDGMGAGQIEAALEAGSTTTDVHVIMERSSAKLIGRFMELLDLADAFCREERLLSLARTEEQQQFQEWFLGEFVRQANGEEPLPWRGSSDPSVRQTSLS
ncbi:ATP-binding protein [Nocardioides sp. cx-173]|uniref:ATP-binding protein n=1 Tax=Nocardioides sp. cx-173 TaxID=2898796 RepID=UPI001E4651B4|nr:ATP-binding protein [Nocardioides sp. cx-173]MCD4524119.1 ATP-binding protein [Nocardioides sp. cx-173]UGB41516.1 ATP-binding protein [Nocardioides sp. cx-173]